MKHDSEAGLSLSSGFCSTHTQHFEEVYETQADPHLDRFRERGAKGAKFMVFGRYDHLFLVTSNESKLLRDVDRGLNLSKEVANQWTSTGRVVHPVDSTFDIESVAVDFPLLGICYLKINRAFTSHSETIGLHLDQLTEAARSEEHTNPDIRIIVVSTTGWEDTQILIFGKRFSEIVAFIAALRTIKDERISSDPLVLTSCTLPAIHLPWQRQHGTDIALRHRSANELLSRIDPHDPLRWSLRFEVEPGKRDELIRAARHLVTAAELHSDPNGGLRFATTFGQIDLSSRIESLATADGVTGSSAGDLVRFLVHVGFPLAAQSPSPARAMETLVELELPIASSFEAVAANLDSRETRSKTAKDLTKQAPTLRQLFRDGSRDSLLDFGIPAPSVALIEGLTTRLDSLHEDTFLRDEFFSLYQLGRAFPNKVSRHLLESRKEESPGLRIAFAESLRIDLGDWQNHLSRCLADRYRGRYPLGESMMVPLASHQCSYHKFLYLADVLVSQTYYCGRDAVNAEYAKHYSGDELEKLSLAIIPIGVFLGESPNLFAITSTVRDLFTGFIDVSSHLVFDLRHIACLFHETGHFVFREFETHSYHPKEPELWKRDRVLISEIFCEAFACALATAGDMRRYSELAHSIIKRYFPDRDIYQHGTLWKTDLIRHAASLLLDACHDSRGDDDQVFSKHLAASVDSFSRYWLVKLKGFDSAGPEWEMFRVTCNTFEYIATELTKEPQFICLVRSLDALVTTDRFVRYDEQAGLLTEVRAFLGSPDLERFNHSNHNFAMLDRLWSRAGVARREIETSTEE